MEALVPLSPALHTLVLMGRVVVADDVNLLVLCHGLIDSTRELQPLLMSVALLADVEDRSVRGVASDKQPGGAVALLVLGHRLAAPLLKLSTRWGFNPCVRQMGPTLDSETPVSPAIVLRDDYAAFGNIVRVLLATICATFSAVMLGLRRILLHSGHMPRPSKRLRQREAVRGVADSRSVICLSSSLSAANKTMRQRSTTRTGVVRHRITFCSSAFLLRTQINRGRDAHFSPSTVDKRIRSA